MGAFDHWSEGPDGDTPTEVAVVGKLATVVRLDAVDETRTPGEAYADSRQALESGWDRHRRFDAPRAELARFRMERAGLPEISPEEAARYIEQQRALRPWLQVAERASPESRRIIAAMDRGAGHGHILHDGWVTEEANMRRVAYLEDPAQLDAGKRLRGIDGLKPNNIRHKCGVIAGRITDPDAFATALARGAEHPKVRAALSRPQDQDRRPDVVRVPIVDLLGKDGHKVCTGWQLEPVSESMNAAKKNRRARLTALAEGRQPNAPEPMARPVPTFEGGTITFILDHNKATDEYKIINLFPKPRDDYFPTNRVANH
jgi:hypothetical protein